jgi:hypothetical protein
VGSFHGVHKHWNVIEVEEEGSNQRPCDEILDDENRGKLLLDVPRVIRHPLLFLKVTDPFVTAHHPICGHFDEHVVTIRGRRWCIGCTFNSISFFGTMLALFGIWLFDSTVLSRFYLFWGGVIATVAYFFISFSGITDGQKHVKVVSKFLLGSGFAGICWSILLIDGLLSEYLTFKLLFIVILYLGFITILNIKRSLEIFKECESCEFKMRWSKCPGFRNIACKLVEEGFVYPEKK